MKTTIKQALIGAAAMLAMAGANAATVTVIPSVTTVAPGGTFSATVVADFTDVGGFTDGGFELSWNTSVLSLVGGSNGVAAELQGEFDAFDTANPGLVVVPTGHSGTVLDETLPNALLQFTFTNCGLSFIPTGTICSTIGSSEAIDLYELSFQIDANATIGLAATDLLGTQWLRAGDDGALNPNDPVIPTYIGAAVTTINEVPVPAAAWLFGSGLLGLIGVARRRSAQAQS